MQLIGQLFEASLRRSGRRITIVGATSGDTGSAAIEAFRGRRGVEVFILFPRRPGLGGAAPADDDARRGQRACAGHRRRLRRRAGAAEGPLQRPRLPRRRRPRRRQLDQLGAGAGADGLLLHRRRGARRPAPAGELHRPDRQLRRRLRRLRRAAHGPAHRPAGDRDQPERHPAPDAGDRRRTCGRGSRRRSARRWTSRSARTSSGCSSSSTTARAPAVAALMGELGGRAASPSRRARSGGCARSSTARAPRRRRRCAAIAATWRATGELVCPHTAVGLHAARARRGDPRVPMVVLATAHPAKFPDAVEAACRGAPGAAGAGWPI